MVRATIGDGPENISATLVLWAARCNITIQHIQPGKPQQNAYVERYNRTVLTEWLAPSIFETTLNMSPETNFDASNADANLTPPISK